MINMFRRVMIVFLMIFCGSNIFAQQMPPNIPLDTTVREAIDFSLIDMETQKINSEDLKGEVVIINFWGIKCKPCIQEMPDLNEMKKEFNSQKIHFIGITGDSEQELIGFLENHPFDYTICSTSDYQKLMIDFNKFPAVPLHFIIDKDWNIVYRYVGKLDGENLIAFKNKIKELI